MSRLPGWIEENKDLSGLNTFGVKARARYFAPIRSSEQLDELIATGFTDHLPFRILGGGSNMLFMGDYNGLILHVQLTGTDFKPAGEQHMLIKTGAGMNWHALVMDCVGKNLGGIENLALIPGTAGAAPVQNIGAYGVELQDVMEHVDIVDLRSGEHLQISLKECAFGYRDSIFKQDVGKYFFISSITLRLTRSEHKIHFGYSALEAYMQQHGVTDPHIQDVCEAVIAIRSSKLPDPAHIGNAGSFFKNPVLSEGAFHAIQVEHPSVPYYITDNQMVKIPAGWLIETAGWKGKTIGHVGTHPMQALVIVNHGGATGQEIFDFSQMICDDVQHKFNVQLQREVHVIQ